MAKVGANAGVKMVVTSCADCYHTFKRLYPDAGFQFEVFHMVEFVDRLVKEGKLKFTRPVPMKVTYHDLCHLGRLGEPMWPGGARRKRSLDRLSFLIPPGSGITVLTVSISRLGMCSRPFPGWNWLKWNGSRKPAGVAGAGGGVRDAFPEFSSWTATERIEEAKATGAGAIVSACPWCERNFMDAAAASGTRMKVFDVIDLVEQAI